MCQVPAGPCLRVVSLLIVLACLLGVPSLASTASVQDDLQNWATSFPDEITADLPAMTLPPGAYPVEGLSVGAGRMLRPVEEAAAFAPVLGVDEGELLRRMRDSGWVTRYLGDVLLPHGADPSVLDVVGWSSITQHESDAGALEGYALLDESGADGVQVIPAREIGGAARLTHATGTDATGRPFERVRYTFVSGPFVGSVAILWYETAAIDGVDAEAMVATGERLFDRIGDVSASGASRLPGLVLRMNSVEGLDIDGYQEMYHVLDSEVIAQLGDSEAAVARAGAFRDQWGIEANYAFRINFTGTGVGEHKPFYQAQLLRLGSVDDAVALVNGHLEYDQTLGYERMEVLEVLPTLDGAVAGVEYVASWPDGTEN
ncbi:MAG TPA: hypothetical protein VD789_10065, partial [Thermomicrobiales bacterium]|nr:hypothetical protein [Thermomicrobiales bacterium]